MEDLIAFRRELHTWPEISGQEVQTAERVKSFLAQYNPDEIVEGIGGQGLLVVFNGSTPGPTVAIRAELDALPIPEINTFDYVSRIEGQGHKCGHDGHMAMVAGLGAYLKEKRPTAGRVILLFQPAEETGEGARLMLKDPRFNNYQPDYIFALHNLPGIPKGTVVTKPNNFAAASKGIILNLQGETSHAAEPENGKSPALALAEIIKKWESLGDKNLPLQDFARITTVHAKLGNPAFGITPGEATLMATLRAFKDDDLEKLQHEAIGFATQCAKENGLKMSSSETEIFAATINDSQCHDIVVAAASRHSYELMFSDKPFKWSEDFGEFTQKYKGAMFGLGAGMDTPDLHNQDYDFPDDLLEIGLNMFQTIIDQVITSEN